MDTGKWGTCITKCCDTYRCNDQNSSEPRMAIKNTGEISNHSCNSSCFKIVELKNCMDSVYLKQVVKSLKLLSEVAMGMPVNTVAEGDLRLDSS